MCSTYCIIHISTDKDNQFQKYENRIFGNIQFPYIYQINLKKIVIYKINF